MKMNFPLYFAIGIYFACSLGGVSIVKFLNYHYCYTSWQVFALLSRSTWILSAILNAFLRYHEGVSPGTSRKQLGLYSLIAIGLSAVEVCNSFTMSVLPGSLYMLIKGSDVGWSMLLSYLMLKKSYTMTKLAAAALVMVGIGVVFLVDLMDDQENYISSQSNSRFSATLGTSLLCLGGALLNSLCTVGTEKMLKQTLKEEQDQLNAQQQSAHPPSKLMLSNTYSMYTSLFSFGILLPISLFSIIRKDGDSHDEAKYDVASNDDNNNSTSSICSDISITSGEETDPTSFKLTMAGLVIGICLALLALSRFMERLTKHFICVYDSAVTFSIVQAARRWFGIYIVGWVFNEGFAEGMIAGSLISGIGFILHSYDTQQTTARSDYKKLSSNISSSDDVDNNTNNNGSTADEIELSAGNRLSNYCAEP